MKLACIKDVENRQTIYKLTISDAEFIRAFFDGFDRMLIDECEISDKVSDKLLALETITRRIESDIEDRIRG